MNKSQDIPSSLNLSLIEKIYAEFLRDPRSIASEWQNYFREIQNKQPLVVPRFGPSFQPPGLFNFSPTRAATMEPGEVKISSLQNRVNQLVRNFRVRGHRIAAVDPLGLPRPIPPELEPGFFGFSEEDLDREII